MQTMTVGSAETNFPHSPRFVLWRQGQIGITATNLCTVVVHIIYHQVSKVGMIAQPLRRNRVRAFAQHDLAVIPLYEDPPAVMGHNCEPQRISKEPCCYLNVGDCQHVMISQDACHANSLPSLDRPE